MRPHLRVTFFLAAISACTVRLDPAPDAIRFNDDLDGELRPLSRDRLDDFATFRADDGRVSPLMPGTGAAAHLQRQLRRSTCFWMAPGDTSLSWELVARALPSTDDDVYSHLETNVEKPTVPIEIGACTLTDPIDREPPIDDDGDPFELEHDSELIAGAHAEITACTGPADSFNSCTTLAHSCRDVPRPCPAQQVGYPLCAQQCPVTVGVDTSFAVEVRADLTSTGLESTLDKPEVLRRMNLGTTIKTVAPSSTLARPLARVTGSNHLTWSTAERADGSWEESFHPDLVVSRVRVFEVTGAERRYLRPAQVRVDGASCSPDSGGAIGLEQCPVLGGVTPTNHNNALDRRIAWDVELAPGDLRAGASYRIEFVVTDRRTVVGLPSVRWREPSIDLGAYDFRATVTRRLWLENNGGAPVVVTGNSSSPRFTLRPATGDLGLGVTIPANGTLAIDVTRVPLAAAPPAGTLERATLALRAGGRAVDATVRGAPFDLGPPVEALPTAMSLVDVTRRFLITNTSRNPSRITDAAASGPHAAALEVTAHEPCAADHPVCKNLPLLTGETRVYQVARTATCATGRTIPVTFTVEECVTPGGTCGDGDDWRSAAPVTVAVTMFPTSACP